MKRTVVLIILLLALSSCTGTPGQPEWPQEADADPAVTEASEADEPPFTNIDVEDNDFPITLDVAYEAVFSKSERIKNQHQVERFSLRADSIRIYDSNYYYYIYAYHAGDTEIIRTFAYYCVDVYTGEVFELQTHFRPDELIPLHW